MEVSESDCRERLCSKAARPPCDIVIFVWLTYLQFKNRLQNLCRSKVCILESSARFRSCKWVDQYRRLLGYSFGA